MKPATSKNADVIPKPTPLTAKTMTQATTTGTSASCATSKTPPTATPSQKQRRGPVRRPRRQMNQSVLRYRLVPGMLPRARTTPAATAFVPPETPTLQIILSDLPAGIKLGLAEARMLLYLAHVGALPQAQWQAGQRQPAAIAALCLNGYLRTLAEPLRYGLTRPGLSLALWIRSSLRHAHDATSPA